MPASFELKALLFPHFRRHRLTSATPGGYVGKCKGYANETEHASRISASALEEADR